MPRGNYLSIGGGAGAGVALAVVGGLMGMSSALTGVVKMLQVASEAKLKNAGIKCLVCKGVGFYICKLCRGNSTILNWSPLYDPFVFNPVLCPTCDAYSVQKCLNCVGKGCT